MEKIEKVTIDKEKIKEFVEKSKKSKKKNKIEFFSDEIEGKKYYLELNYINDDGDRCFYFSGAAVDDILFFDDVDDEFGGGVWDWIIFERHKRISLEKITEQCQTETDSFVDAINKQQELIEQAIKDGVKRYDEDGGYYERKDFGFLMDDLNHLWNYKPFWTYEEGDNIYSGWRDYKDYIEKCLENKTANQNS